MNTDLRYPLRHSTSIIFQSLALLGLLSGLARAEQVLEEVVVTATKRGNVSVQDIPAGIRAIAGAVMDDYGMRGFEDLSRLEPSVAFSTQGDGDTQLIIRGIQSPGQSTVGVYLDEAVVTGGNFQDGGGRLANIRLYDVDRIEILKGPQGTLFGASSMSGTVRVITNQPQADALDASFSVGAMSTEKGASSYDFNGMINVPLVKDTFAVRAVGWTSDGGGYIDHTVGAGGATLLKDINDVQVSGGRLSGRWTPNDQLTITAFGIVQETEVDGPQYFVPADGDLQITSQPVRQSWGDELYIYGGTLEYVSAPGVVTGSVAYFDRDIDTVVDTTGRGRAFGLPFAALAAPVFWDRSIFSTELRFSSTLNGPLNYVLGFFYEEDENVNEVSIINADPATGIPPCLSQAACRQAGSESVFLANRQELDLSSYAFFGHVDFELSEAFTLGAGLRYFDSDQDARAYSLQNAPGTALNPFIPGPGPFPFQTAEIQTQDDNTKQDKVTYDASLSYKRTQDQLYYARVASGFRSGGINDTASATGFGVDIPGSYEPDSVTSVEFGSKNSWMDDRVRVNAAYFKMFWDDIHVPGTDASGAFDFIDNAAKAEVDGLELELFARPTDGLYLVLGVTWLDARLTRDQDTPLPPKGFDGDNVPRVPDWSFSGSAEYRFPVSFMDDVETVLRSSFAYTGESTTFFNDTDPSNTPVGDYFLVDLNVSFLYKNWELKLLANNVTDERAILDVNNTVNGFNAYTARPRTYGLELKWHY